MDFLEWKLLNSRQIFTEIYSLGSNYPYSSIGSDNGLAPTRREAIIWSNICMLYRRIYASRRFNELISPKNICNFSHKSSTQYQITSYNYTECGRKLQLYICGKVVHSNAICRANIGSGNGLSPVRCKAVTWISTEILSVGPWGANFCRISIKILFLFHSKKCILRCCLQIGGHFVGASTYL